jgi:hypothetical protein
MLMHHYRQGVQKILAENPLQKKLHLQQLITPNNKKIQQEKP